MWSKYLWRWYSVSTPSLFFFSVEDISWCLLCTYLFICIRLVFTSHLLGVVLSSDALLSFSERTLTFIYWASPFAWVSYLEGWLSHQILSLWDLSSTASATHHPPGRGGVEGTFCWGDVGSSGITGAWELVSGTSKACVWHPPNLMTILPLTYSVGKQAGCVRQQGQWECRCLYFFKQFCCIPYPCTRSL